MLAPTSRPPIKVVVRRPWSVRETQYTGPGHGIDAHVADRARLHARVYNCTTQLQGVLDNESFGLVPSHDGEKSPMQTPTTHESSSGRAARNPKRVLE